MFTFFASTAARADTIDFTITGTGISSSGAITVSTTGTPGVDRITGISGNYSNTNAGGFSGAISGLLSGSYSASSPTTIAAAPGWVDTFDNLFYPTGGAPACMGYGAGGLLDGCGLTFSVGADRVNLFGNGLGKYDVFDWTPSAVIDANVPLRATFTVVTPEPGTLDLTLIGLAMVCLMVVIRKRRSQGQSLAA
jgi:hypothetical protein